jgi:hypothetical protein
LSLPVFTDDYFSVQYVIYQTKVTKLSQKWCRYSILPKAYIESLAVNPDIVPSLEEDTQDDDIIDWVKAQAMDPVIKPFIKYVRERRSHGIVVRQHSEFGAI